MSGRIARDRSADAPAWLANRSVLREVARRQHPERHVLFPLPRAPPPDENTAVAAYAWISTFTHHPRLIRRVAPPGPPRTAHEMPSDPSRLPDRGRGAPSGLRQPRPHVRRQRPHVGRQPQRLFRCVAAKSRRHQVLPASVWLTLVASFLLRHRRLAGLRDRRGSLAANRSSSNHPICPGPPRSPPSNTVRRGSAARRFSRNRSPRLPPSPPAT